MLKGIEFLNKYCKIIHTDIKPENILLTFPLPKYNKPVFIPTDLYYPLIGFSQEENSDCILLKDLTNSFRTQRTSSAIGSNSRFNGEE